MLQKNAVQRRSLAPSARAKDAISDANAKIIAYARFLFNSGRQTDVGAVHFPPVLFVFHIGAAPCHMNTVR